MPTSKYIDILENFDISRSGDLTIQANNLMQEEKEIIGAINRNHKNGLIFKNQKNLLDLENMLNLDAGIYKCENLYGFNKGYYTLIVLLSAKTSGDRIYIVNIDGTADIYIGATAVGEFKGWKQIIGEKLFLGHNGLEQLKYIQEKVIKEQGKGYIDKDTGKLYLCIQTTTAEITQPFSSYFMQADNISIANKLFLTNIQKLDTSYMATKMQQEGVYNDYISYMDEKTIYDQQQKENEKQKQKQLAYQKALKTNPNLTYKEWLSAQPTTLVVNVEPQPSPALQAFIKKYL